MKEKLQEIYEGLKERLKSPFLLTFVTVWTIHNWEFVYGVVAFNEDMPFIKRTAFLKAYLLVHSDNQLLWFPLLWSFASITLYFAATFLFEGINLLYTKWIRTFLYWAIDRNKLKTEDDINELEERRKNLQELVFDLRRKEEDAAIKLKTAQNTMETELSKVKDNLADEIRSKSKIELEIQNKDSEITRIQKELETIQFSNEVQKDRVKDLQEFKDWINAYAPALIFQFERKEPIQFGNEIKKQIDIERFRKLFSGTWQNNYIPAKGTSGTETFHLGLHDNQLAFIIEGAATLLITDIEFDDDNGLSFTKTNTKVNMSPMRNKLIIDNEYSLVGTENETTQISYTRIQSPSA